MSTEGDGAPDRDAGARPPETLDRFWNALGRQLRRPSGTEGAIVGRLMAFLNAQPYRLTIDALDLQPGDAVLDIGCGSGRSFDLLLARLPFGRAHGIDHSERMINQAKLRNRAAVAEGGLELVRGASSALPWPDGTFDKILIVNVVYFFDKDGRDIAEARRVLRPAGRVAVYATDRASMEKWPFAGPDTHTKFGAADLTTLLESGGFVRSRIRIEAVTLPFGIRGNIAIAENAPS